MIQDIEPYTYDNHYVPREATEKSYALHYQGNSVLLRVVEGGAGGADAGAAGDGIDLPRLADYPECPHDLVYLFRVGDEDYFLVRDQEVAVPAGFTYEAVNWLRHAHPQHLLFAAAVGWQLGRWYDDNRFCSRCGHPMELAPRSRELVCPSCAKIVYPKIQPGVIVGIVDGDSLVLTRYAGRDLKIYALVAGFTEIGESLEETCRREVMEEVGLSIKNLAFYKSQPWPFSDTLLAGFWCEVDGDPTITVDHTELKEAVWLRQDQIPPERVGDRASLTGEMIERFRARGHAVLEG